MDGGASFYWLMATAAAGTAVSVVDTKNTNDERERVLKEELRSNELAALDEENERLIALREANDEILANAGGIEAWASPSLLAARIWNFQVGFKDIDNINFNRANVRSGISARIGVLQRNSRATLTSGILQVIGTATSTINQGALLKKTEEA